MKIALSTKPESVYRLFLRSFRLYSISFSHVLFLAFILSFIIFIPRLISVAMGRDIFNNLPLFSIHKIWLALLDFGSLIFFSAILWRVRCFMIDAHETLFDDLKVAVRKLPFIVIAAILQTVLVTVLSFFTFVILYFLVFDQQTVMTNINMTDQVITGLVFIIQSILVLYIFFALYFYLPIIVIEDKGIFSSLARSAELVWGNWWRTVCVQTLPWLAYVLSLLVIKFVVGLDIHIYFFTNPNESYFATLFHLILFAIFIPWVACVLLVQLHDLELRKNSVKM